MEKDELEKLILNDYNECFNEEDSIDDNINNYIAGLYYDLLDDVAINRDMFNVPKELTDIESVKYIEEQIEKILEEKLKGELENEK